MSLDRFNTDAAAWEQFSPTPTDLTRPDATDTPPVDVVTKNIDRPIEEIGLEENLREARPKSKGAGRQPEIPGWTTARQSKNGKRGSN
jgi:hypothetical protein